MNCGDDCRSDATVDIATTHVAGMLTAAMASVGKPGLAYLTLFGLRFALPGLSQAILQFQIGPVTTKGSAGTYAQVCGVIQNYFA